MQTLKLMRFKKMEINYVNLNPSRILSALAEVWQIHLETETGKQVRVTVKEEGNGCPD